jgi:alpha-L-rhamnosidase
VTELKTEHLSAALGIQAERPRFRWLLDAHERGQRQTAYQIIVSSSEDKLRSDIGDKWDSGKVRSDNSVEVFYEGDPLTSGERSYWKVRVWDKDGRATRFSDASFFETGLLRQSDWQGKWITGGAGISAPLFRHEFTIDDNIRRARLYIAGLGCYELYINGKKIGDRVLEPASTYYNNDQPYELGSRVLYATYDVGGDIRPGTNAIGVVLGHCWYSAEADSPLRDPYGPTPRLIIQLNIELESGRHLAIETDNKQWRVSSGPIIYNDLTHGETYDARNEQPGWATAGFDESSWAPASVTAPLSGALTAQLLPPARIMRTIPPVKVIKPKTPEFFDNTYIYDFGQHFTGWVRLSVSGPRGAKLILRYGSRIYTEDDTLDTRSNSPPVMGARQTDTYILKGDGIELWEPRFTLHGFRYVEVQGFRETPSVHVIEGRFVHSSVESTGEFESSNSLINQIHKNIQWTFSSSLQGYPQDAAERSERFGWLGDPGFVAEDYLNNYDMVGFFEKWLDDIQDSQKADGAIPLRSPLHWRAWRSSNSVWPAWQSTYPMLVWYMYQYYGNTDVLLRHYENIQKLLRFQTRAAEDHIITAGLGDHMEPQVNESSLFSAKHTPAALTSTAYYYYSVALLARMSDVLGRSADAKRHRILAEKIRTAFNRKFFDFATNQYAGGSQTSNALALYLGMVPSSHISKVRDNLLQDIQIQHNGHASTGIIGSNALVHALPLVGASDVMYRITTKTDYPSLGYQITKGATALCETYECNPWLSQNMKMFGSVDKFFYRDLAGIRPETPGYRRVQIAPQPVGDLQSVSASQKTVRGRIRVAWMKGNIHASSQGTTSFVLNVQIPAGVEADIVVPTFGLRTVSIAESGRSVWQSDRYLPGTPGIVRARGEHERVVLSIGSGDYEFMLTGVAF